MIAAAWAAFKKMPFVMPPVCAVLMRTPDFRGKSMYLKPRQYTPGEVALANERQITPQRVPWADRLYSICLW
jgi:hypothetical protein